MHLKRMKTDQDDANVVECKYNCEQQKNITTISKTLHVDFYVYEQCETDGDLANGVVVL